MNEVRPDDTEDVLLRALADSREAYLATQRSRLQLYRRAHLVGRGAQPLAVLLAAAPFAVLAQTSGAGDFPAWAYVSWAAATASVFVWGMYLFVFQEALERKERIVRGTFDDRGEHGAALIRDGRPFLLYARRFDEEDAVPANGEAGGGKKWVERVLAVEGVADRAMGNRRVIPPDLDRLLRITGCPLLAIAHTAPMRHLGPVHFLFLTTRDWQSVFGALAERADLIVVNLLEGGFPRHRLPEGLRWEVQQLLPKPEFLAKTLVLRQTFGGRRSNDEPDEARALVRKARWFAEYEVEPHQDPEGSLPEGFADAVRALAPRRDPRVQPPSH